MAFQDTAELHPPVLRKAGPAAPASSPAAAARCLRCCSLLSLR